MAVTIQSLLLLAVGLLVTVTVGEAAVVQNHGSRKLMTLAEGNAVTVGEVAVAQSTDATSSHSRKMLQWWGWYDSGYNGYNNWDNKGYDNGYNHGGWYRNGGKCEDKTKKYGGWCKNKKGCKICTCSWWYYSYTWRGGCSNWAEWY